MSSVSTCRAAKESRSTVHGHTFRHGTSDASERQQQQPTAASENESRRAQPPLHRMCVVHLGRSCRNCSRIPFSDLRHQSHRAQIRVPVTVTSQQPASTAAYHTPQTKQDWNKLQDECSQQQLNLCLKRPREMVLFLPQQHTRGSTFRSFRRKSGSQEWIVSSVAPVDDACVFSRSSDSRRLISSCSVCSWADRETWQLQPHKDQAQIR